MSYKGIGKNGSQILSDACQRVPGDISGNNIFYILVAGKEVSAVSAISGFKQGITDEIYAFMMAFEEHCTFLYYLKPSLNYHRPLFVKCPPAPSFVALGKHIPDKTEPFPAA